MAGPHQPTGCHTQTCPSKILCMYVYVCTPQDGTLALRRANHVTADVQLITLLSHTSREISSAAWAVYRLITWAAAIPGTLIGDSSVSNMWFPWLSSWKKVQSWNKRIWHVFLRIISRLEQSVRNKRTTGAKHERTWNSVKPWQVNK